MHGPRLTRWVEHHSWIDHSVAMYDKNSTYWRSGGRIGDHSQRKKALVPTYGAGPESMDVEGIDSEAVANPIRARETFIKMMVFVPKASIILKQCPCLCVLIVCVCSFLLEYSRSNRSKWISDWRHIPCEMFKEPFCHGLEDCTGGDGVMLSLLWRRACDVCVEPDPDVALWFVRADGRAGRVMAWMSCRRDFVHGNFSARWSTFMARTSSTET